MNIYKRKYNKKQLIKDIKKFYKDKIDIDELFYLIGYDPIDVYYFYVNNVKGSFRYETNYNIEKDK